MTETTSTSSKIGRPRVPDEHRKSKNRFSIGVSDTTLAALDLLPQDFPAWNAALIASQVDLHKAEQGD